MRSLIAPSAARPASSFRIGTSSTARRRAARGAALALAVIETLEMRRMLAVDFTQGANGDAGHSPPLGDVTWINGILNPNNSEYFEGVSTLQRILFTDVGATAGNNHTLTFSHQAAKGSAHAYDFLTSWDQTLAATNAIAPGTLVDPHTDGPDANTTIEAFEPGSSSPANFTTLVAALHASGSIVNVPVPDNMPNLLGDNVAARISAYEGFFGNRTIRIYANAAIDTSGSATFLTFNNYSGSGPLANYTFTWKSAATQVLIEFGAHLAQGQDFTLAGVGYGAGKGAGSISGGPYHVQLKLLDGASLGSQDNQIQANAVGLPPSFTIDKTGDTLSKIGDSINYTITINNNGSLPLFPQSIIDSLLGTLAASSFIETGGTNDNILQVGETWTLNTSRTVQPGDPDPLINTVTAVFDTSAGLTGLEVTHSDSHTTELFQPSIDLEKSANRTLAAVGDSITYTYTLDNTGSSDSPALMIVSLVDDNGTPANALDDFTPTFGSGDTDSDGKLDLSEIWTYSATRTVLNTDASPLVNTAVVHSNPVGFPNDITDTDTASVGLFVPVIDIDKTGDALSKIGDQVTYTYVVTNASAAGSPALENVTVVDDNATAATGDDFSPDFQSGDTNMDGKLDIGETWTYTKTVTIPVGASDPYVNTATASGKAVGSVATDSDTDTHSVELFQPLIDLDKTGPLTALVGDTITYTYSVRNTGSSDSPPLVNVSITDDNGTPGAGNTGDDFSPTFTGGDTDSDGKLDAGEVWTYTAQRTILNSDADPLINTATVTSNPDGFPNVISDTDTHAVDHELPPGGQVLPTGTTADQFIDELINGNVNPNILGELSDGFNLQITRNKISNVSSPGQAFYFTLFTAPADGDSNPFTVRIQQTSTGGNKYLMDLTQVQIYAVIGSAPNATTQTLLNNVSFSVLSDGIQFQLPDNLENVQLVARIRIEPKSIEGENAPASDLVNHFKTFVNGVLVDQDVDGVLLNIPPYALPLVVTTASAKFSSTRITTQVLHEEDLLLA